MTDPLVEAILDQCLPEFARRLGADDAAPVALRSRAQRAVDTCAAIGRRVQIVRDEIAALAHEEGIAIRGDEAVAARQNHTIHLRVDDADAADRLAALLQDHGFERWESWTGAAALSFRRAAYEMTVARTDDVTTVVRIAWADPPRRSRFDRVFRPTSADWEMVDLPRPAWRLYSAVRPIRLLVEGVGLRRRHQATIGPFLATPETLIGPLLDFADVSVDDCVMDVGCGDGRLVVAAAERFGCRAVGVERSPELVDRARARADAAGVGDLVQIRLGDARAVDLSGTTVLFMFLPVHVIEELLSVTLAALPRGARVVAHEQSRLPATNPLPDATAALIGDGAVTVAHRWAAGVDRP